MQISPLVSIIVPTYNRADILLETIQSIINQTYQNWECIIVDDGSQDNTQEECLKLIEKDKRIYYFKRPENRNAGGNGARNFGFLKSKGEYIKWLDSDDLITNLLLEKEIEAITKTHADVCLSSWIYFDAEKNSYTERNNLVIQNPSSGTELLHLMGTKGEFSYPSCYLVKRELLFISGLWNEKLKINQDGEFFFRVLINSEKLTSIKYLGTLHRKDGENKVSQKSDIQSIENRLKSWVMIDSQVQIIASNELLDYIEGTKRVLYNEIKRKNLIQLIFKYKSFFSKCIINEKSRKMKLKFLLFKLKNISN